ncbi:uncharacterized protein LOC130970842 isoform X2 [Arachis stenosperma]|uniref:uncharacterized protein LOC130970842 isoform X2 n=1 Tax=Arachis stenosperma TaxID=217475 RepID=UPI0025ACC8F2|nr:uncharacterized protein LOC130970842 isoform X2 [Arachis stenosperma]
MRDCKNSGGAKEEHDEEKVTVALHIGLPNNNNSSSNERKKVFHDDAAERFWIPTAAQTFTRYNNMQVSPPIPSYTQVGWKLQRLPPSDDRASPTSPAH